MIGDRAATGNMPPAEALIEWNAVACFTDTICRETSAARPGNDGSDDQARNIPRVLSGMAVHAAFGTFDTKGAGLGRNVANVEYSAELRVQRNDLNTPAGHVAEVDVFVEVERARIRWRDEAQLEAGGGEHQHLGRGRN